MKNIPLAAGVLFLAAAGFLIGQNHIGSAMRGPDVYAAVFDPSAARVGDRVGEFVITEIDTPFIVFSGSVVLHGDLVYEVAGIGGVNYFLKNIFAADMAQLPHTKSQHVRNTLPVDPDGHLPPGFSTEEVPGTSSSKPVAIKATLSEFAFYTGANPHGITLATFSSVE